MSTSSELLQQQQIEEVVDRKLDETLRSIIREEIKQALKDMPPHGCRFDISNHECQAVVNYVHSVSRLSPDRDIDDGLDVIRDNHKWLQGLRQGGAKAAAAFFMILLTGAATAFLVTLWEGVKIKLKGP